MGTSGIVGLGFHFRMSERKLHSDLVDEAFAASPSAVSRQPRQLVMQPGVTFR